MPVFSNPLEQGPTQPPHDGHAHAVDADDLRDAGIVPPPYFGLDDKSLAVARLHRIVQEAADVSRMAYNAQSRETWTEDDESSLRLAEGEMAVIRRALRRLNGVTA